MSDDKNGGPEKKKGAGQGNTNDTESVRGGVFKGISTLASIGITLVAATFIGLIMGIYLDRYFSTHPWFTIIFLVLGIAAGFKNIYTLVKKYGVWGD